jgi:hypothetical protein
MNQRATNTRFITTCISFHATTKMVLMKLCPLRSDSLSHKNVPNTPQNSNKLWYKNFKGLTFYREQNEQNYNLCYYYHMSEKPVAEQIDDIITKHGGWKGEVLQQLRAAILAADSGIIEEIKWRMKTRPEGLPVWSSNGIVCFAEIWKDNVKLLLPNGAHLTDHNKLFNARLQSADIRAIEFREGDTVNAPQLKTLVQAAVKFNRDK